LIRIHAEIEQYTTEAEQAGDEGDIDKAQDLMTKIEDLNREKAGVLVSVSVLTRLRLLI
jgi:hypothetical protein